MHVCVSLEGPWLTKDKILSYHLNSFERQGKSFKDLLAETNRNPLKSAQGKGEFRREIQGYLESTQMKKYIYILIKNEKLLRQFSILLATSLLLD